VTVIDRVDIMTS